MKVTFSALHFDASDRLQTFATAEMQRLERYVGGHIDGDVVLKANGAVKVAEMRINALGRLLPVKVEGDDFYKIIPRGIEKLEKQLKSQKSKLYDR